MKLKNSTAIKNIIATKSYVSSDIRHKGSPSYQPGTLTESQFESNKIISSGKMMKIKINDKEHEI
jgi:hypothetical protein